MRSLSNARRLLLAAAMLLAAGASAAVLQSRVQAARQRTGAAVSMASMLPQGALLTIESPDFAALLKVWNASPEQRAWFASDNFAALSHSRLFERLNDARVEFETLADPGVGAAINSGFLTQVAGSRSIFAWYDVGKLEFLYISRITPAQASNVALLRDRGAYTARQAGGTTFYLRNTGTAPGSPADDQGSSAQGTARTIAFAEVTDPSGVLLVLATREDLIANALLLMHPPATGTAAVAEEPWYLEASAALPTQTPAPALHMVLDLDRIVPMPYFRSYWVQQNITQMKRYRAAVSDLYVEPRRFHEERVLLLRSTDDIAEDPSLSGLASLAPPPGVFRAFATHEASDAVAAIEQKVLGHADSVAPPESNAPDPSLDAPRTGSGADLETSIDTPLPRSEARTNEPLTQAIDDAGLQGLLTYSTALSPATPEGLWVPMHAAVVLHGAAPWNLPKVQAALQQSLRGTLTTSNLGIAFTPSGSAADTLYALSGPRPLFMATHGSLLLLADDRTLLEGLLQGAGRFPAALAASDIGPTRMAAFDHSSQRAPFARLTSLVDGTNEPPGAGDPPPQPAFFSGNIRSLSDALAPLAREEFQEWRQGAVLRQSVVYRWQNP